MRIKLARQYLMLFLFLITGLNGCASFTSRDYELQEKAYERQRQQEALKDKESLQLRW